MVKSGVRAVNSKRNRLSGLLGHEVKIFGAGDDEAQIRGLYRASQETLIPEATELAFSYMLSHVSLHVVFFAIASALALPFFFVALQQLEMQYMYRVMATVSTATAIHLLFYKALYAFITQRASAFYAKSLAEVERADFFSVSTFYDPAADKYCLYTLSPDATTYAACICFSCGSDVQSSDISGSIAQKEGEIGVFRVSCHPEHTRKGHALKLLKAGETIARSLGCRKMWLETSNIQVAACNLYKKAGFKLTYQKYVEFGCYLRRFEKNL